MSKLIRFYTGCYKVIEFSTGEEQYYSSLDLALKGAGKLAGNTNYNKPFPNEHTYLFGPGDGTVSHTVKQYSIHIDVEE